MNAILPSDDRFGSVRSMETAARSTHSLSCSSINVPKNIRITCTKCNARYVLDAKQGGRMGRCSQCDERFILPIPNAEQMLQWARSATWQRLSRFIDNSGARGHERDVIDQLVEIVNQSKWAEEHRTYREASPQKRSLSRREQIWEQSDRKLRRSRTLMELRNMHPSEFERLAADIFATQGLTARAVGQTADDGIDVKIWDADGKFWGIAQCKRYAENNPITSRHIRSFGGSYLLCNAVKGFYFTTSRFTRHAKRTARGYPWLTIYNGKSLVQYLEEINRQFKAVGTINAG